MLGAWALAGPLTGAPTASAAVEPQGIVPTDYFYSVAWHPRARQLTGRASIRVENRSKHATRYLWLRLRVNSGDDLERIHFRHGARIVRRAAGGSMLQIRTTAPIPAGGHRNIRFGLRLKVPRAESSLGRSAGVDLFGDALPVVPVSSAHGVRVAPEPSYGEGSLNVVADWIVEVRVPRGIRPILPEHQNLLREERHSNTYYSWLTARDYAFAIGNVHQITEKVDGVRVTVAGTSAMKHHLPLVLKRAVKAFKTMRGWYGGYSLSDLKLVVGDLEFGGSEYPGLVFTTPDNATIAHEVAHQWFYGLVGNDQYKDPFLDESLTAFSEQRFHKSYRCDLARPIRGEHGLGTGMGYWEKHAKAYEDTIYRGGACALTVLRRDIGSAAFDAGLRAYVAANQNKIAGIDDFLAAIRNAAPEYDLARWQKLVGL